MILCFSVVILCLPALADVKLTKLETDKSELRSKLSDAEVKAEARIASLRAELERQHVIQVGVSRSNMCQSEAS